MAEHQQALGPMVLQCTRARASFPGEGIALANDGIAGMIWDEHGGTFILRVEGLKPAPAGEPEAAAIRVEVAPAPSGLAGRVREFAAQHCLPLTAPAPPGSDLVEAPILCACHVPGRSLFIYSEDALLVVRATGSTLELAVTGTFKARRLPSRETDVIIHLAPAAMAHLLSFLLALAATGP